MSTTSESKRHACMTDVCGDKIQFFFENLKICSKSKPVFLCQRRNIPFSQLLHNENDSPLSAMSCALVYISQVLAFLASARDK